MAIQQIDLAVPNGDTVRSANVKINQNFSNSTHAASKLVGDTNGKIPTWEQTLLPRPPLRQGQSGNHPEYPIEADFDIANDVIAGYKYFWHKSSQSSWSNLTNDDYITGWEVRGYNSNRLQIGFDYTGSSTLIFRTSVQGGTFRSANNGWVKVYTTGNTTRDTATGFLKASSPVLHVYNDSITKIHEANELDITVDKKGTGHYEIHGTTGLRKNDGWFMSPPRDVHGNVLCMVDLEEKDGVVILKTYKKKFDFETVSIVHDYDNPMDIPDGVCVEFRFNDLPREQLD